MISHRKILYCTYVVYLDNAAVQSSLVPDMTTRFLFLMLLTSAASVTKEDTTETVSNAVLEAWRRLRWTDVLVVGADGIAAGGAQARILKRAGSVGVKSAFVPSWNGQADGYHSYTVLLGRSDEATGATAILRGDLTPFEVLIVATEEIQARAFKERLKMGGGSYGLFLLHLGGRDLPEMWRLMTLERHRGVLIEHKMLVNNETNDYYIKQFDLQGKLF